MKKDYHIHAQILRETVDSEVFIQTAISRGFDEICITDHMPLSLSNAADSIPAGRVSEYCEKVHELAANMTYMELSTHPGYMDEFVAACFLPHTNGSLFPSSVQE